MPRETPKPTTTSPTTYARTARNVPTMAITTAVVVGATQMWQAIFSLILRDLGASDLNISFTISIWASVGAVAQYFAGRLADRIGRVPLISVSMQVGGLALIGAAFMPSWVPFAFIYTFWQVANGVTGPVFSLITGESVPPRERGRAFGLIESCIGLSLIIGPLTGAKLLPSVGSKGLLIISGVLVVAAATGRLLLLRETRPASTGSKPFAFRHIFEGRMGLVMTVVMLWNVVLAMTWWGPFISLHANDAMGLSKAAINTLFAVSALASALMGLVAGRLVGRFGANRVFSTGALGVGLVVLVWSFQHSLVWITASFLLMSGFFMTAMVASDTFRVTAIDESVRGSALGSIGMVTGFATAAATPVAGFLKQVSPLAPFVMALAAAIGMVVAIAALTRHDARTGFKGDAVQEETPTVAAGTIT